MALNDSTALPSSPEVPEQGGAGRPAADAPALVRDGAPSWLGPAYAASLVLVLLGERVFATVGWARVLLSALGVLGVLGAAALRLLAARFVRGERARIERLLALLSLQGVLALAVYFATAERGKAVLGVAAYGAEARQRFEAGATVAWVILLVATVLPMVFAEGALRPMRRAERVEGRRVLTAASAGLVLAFASSYAALFTFVAGELDWKADFSYFRTARPSESTRNVASSIAEPIRVLSFFPELNEVGREVDGYLRELARSSPQLKVERHDRLLVPAVAREAKVTQDGVVVLQKGESRETLNLGVEMGAARAKLKSLDGDFQKALIKLARERRTAYLTVGHGELNENTAPAPDGRSAKGMRDILEAQGYTVRDLGLAQGLGQEVPDDAYLVLVLGPAQPFLPEEVLALKRYAERGGRLLLALDAEGGAGGGPLAGAAPADHGPLAALVGISWKRAVLANDKEHLRRRFNDSDRTILATNRFSSHASVSTLSRASAKAGVVLLGASSLEKAGDAPADAKIDFTVRSLPNSFADENGNFQHDAPAEKRAVYNLAAAVTRAVPDGPGVKAKPPELRAFVLADVDALSDAAFLNVVGNQFLAADVLRWLGGEESFTGAIATPEDVRIEHTKQQDQMWFYGLIFGAPALVLGGGLAYARRNRRRKEGGRR